ncbi:uncharacterized protein LOC109595282 [Aethina tumida]|uniref:uncharacterized protein LOC109595282 n=1 Tax=Aethina tumida TaxID=116153 RepID=UPI0021492892|nr:uncharacterized protein LOC109595282 [Aethina tumida]
MEIPELPESVQLYLEKIRSHIIKFSLEHPFAALFIVITACAFILPIITVSVLMPVVWLVHFSQYVSKYGILYVMYIIFFQGVLLAVVLISLFFAAFALATSLSVVHSYKFKVT